MIHLTIKLSERYYADLGTGISYRAGSPTHGYKTDHSQHKKLRRALEILSSSGSGMRNVPFPVTVTEAMVVAVAERGLSSPAAAEQARAAMSSKILSCFIVNCPDLVEG